MQKQPSPRMNSRAEGNPRIKKYAISEFNENQLGVEKPAVILFTSIESDFEDQIKILELAVNNISLDISAYLIEKESMDSFAQRYHVKGSPTYLLFKSGLEKGRILGKTSIAELTDFLNKHLSPESQ